ncbi:hypothetical protein [Kitasatospora camelliae]|uniref:Uncharacterized protein n=1 Tax=Kitasatospora camelliae TaxID=3156397 RepID=A0AAU8JQ20_9ACTN
MRKRWGWLEATTDRTRPGGVRLGFSDQTYATVEEARAALQLHLDRRAAKSRWYSCAARRLREAPYGVAGVRLRRRSWTVYEIAPDTAPAEAARRAANRLHHPAGGRFATVAGAVFLVVLLFGGGSLVLSGITKLHTDVPRCHGALMAPGDVCRARITGVATDGMPEPSDTGYEEQRDNLTREGWTSVGLGLILLALSAGLVVGSAGARVTLASVRAAPGR